MDSTSDLTPDEKREMRGLVMASTRGGKSTARSWARPMVAVGLVLAGGVAVGAIYASTLTRPTTIGEAPPAPITLEAFTRAAIPTDALPTDLPDYAYENVIEESSRFVGEQDSVSFYVARGIAQGPGESPLCVLTYPTGGQEDWSVTCGGLPIKATTGDIAIAWLHPAGEDTEGWTDLDANLSVKTGWGR